MDIVTLRRVTHPTPSHHKTEQITTMTDEAPPHVKRRRITAFDGPNEGNRCITDLPSGILAHSSTFLAAPSKALFAIALDENLAVPHNERSSAIVGNNWDTLDFGEIEKELAAKLEDLDITRVLFCVDAVNNVKILKLANCTKIFGICLELLRGSSIIEQIDLSVVGEQQNPDLNGAINISWSCEHVLPILDSIIAREGCALKYLQFPSMWRKEPSTDSAFHAFIGRYNEMRRNRGTVNCLECNGSLPTNPGDEWIRTTFSEFYGTQLHTCYGCLKHYCYGCNIDGEEKNMTHECGACRRDYCKGCSTLTDCSFCRRGICNDCYKCECFQCNEIFCSECIDEGGSLRKCDYCDKFCCEDCNYEAVDIIYTCNRCDVKCCKDCGLQRYRHGELHCAGCIKESVPVLEHERLQKENEELKAEMVALKRQIEDLKLENDELRSRNIE